jgi:hypothetical protein
MPLPSATCAGGTLRRRVLGLAVSAPAALLLGIAAVLTPSPTGLGTHRQMMLPSCGWVAVLDVPCPTCGMTTAFAHAADGHLISSFLTQPMGFALALATAMALQIGLYIACTGSALGGVFARLLTRRTGWMVGLAFLASWVYKVLSYKGVL